MSEQNIRLEEIKKRCGTSRKVLKVFQILIAVAAVISLAGGIIVLSNADRISQAVARDYANGNFPSGEMFRSGGLVDMSLDFEGYFREGNFAFPIFIMTMIGSAAAIISLVIVIMIKNIIQTLIEEETPFSEKIFKKLKVCFIVFTIVIILFVGVGSGAVLGLLLWCIYSVLQYGAALQAEVDETL